MMAESENNSRKDIGTQGRTVAIIKKAFLLIPVCCFLISSTGCDAFVRKFTRKPRNTAAPEVMVLSPEEYKAAAIPKEDQARQYFLFWKSWHDELIEALLHNQNRKKQLTCLDEIVKDLKGLSPLLVDDKKKVVENAVNGLTGLRRAVEQDVYGRDNGRNARQAEHIRRIVLKELPYGRLSTFLSK